MTIEDIRIAIYLFTILLASQSLVTFIYLFKNKLSYRLLIRSSIPVLLGLLLFLFIFWIIFKYSFSTASDQYLIYYIFVAIILIESILFYILNKNFISFNTSLKLVVIGSIIGIFSCFIFFIYVGNRTAPAPNGPQIPVLQ